MTGWDFRDYVDSRGENAIHDWLDSLPKKAKVKINVHIENLRSGVLDLCPPSARALRNDPYCIGLIELRRGYDGVQYRPLGYKGPTAGTVTLLVGAIEKNDRLTPTGVCRTAKNRMADVERDMSRYSCVHDST